MANQINWQVGLPNDPFQSGFNVNVISYLIARDISQITIEDVYNLLQELLRYLEVIFSISSGLKKDVSGIKKLVPGQSSDIQTMKSLINDFRRELLRGNRDIGR